MAENLYIGLVHYPVYNKNREIVTTSITNLDLHDIARTCKTYGVMNFFIINPQKSQRKIFMRLKKFWRTDFAKEYNIDRFDAFNIIEFVPDISSANEWIKKRFGQSPVVISTSARKTLNSLNYSAMKEIIIKSFPKLILFGTGYGLSDEIIKESNFHLAPIKGIGSYNHLSVRSAIAVILDRLISKYR